MRQSPSDMTVFALGRSTLVTTNGDGKRMLIGNEISSLFIIHRFQMTASEPPSFGVCEDGESETSLKTTSTVLGDHSKKAKKKSNKKAEKKITKEKAKRHEMIRVS